MISDVFVRFGVAGCSNFLAFPTWYQYLGGTCDSPSITSISDIWLIVAAVIEIMLRVAGIMAVAFVMYGGFMYLTSQAEPDKVTQARKTIINALLGLTLAITASLLINFIAGSIK